jgi:uncharacterized protein YqhQ
MGQLSSRRTTPSGSARFVGIPLLRGIALWTGFRWACALRFSTGQVLSLAGRTSAKGSETAPREISTGMMAMNIVVALTMFVLLFKLLPLMVATWLQDHFTAIQDPVLFSLVDGVIRLGIFILYIVLVSQIRDIRRIFEYHGLSTEWFSPMRARGLTVDNSRHSTFPRCGTSFLMVVMLISALVYAFIPFQSLAMRLLSIVLPIAGISWIRFALQRSGY